MLNSTKQPKARLGATALRRYDIPQTLDADNIDRVLHKVNIQFRHPSASLQAIYR